MQRETKEKYEYHADGTVKHELKSELKDKRSIGEKFGDAKEAFKGDPSIKEKHIKDKVEVKDDKIEHKHKEELRDPRSIGEKIGDAKDAFLGKAA